ncbi:hypothetical protein [Chryseobacterium indoltheticum]|uniref:hypothetical protein n=1 Tax=Chryseobacterium indoltheticum TaxID=254 RepID=UPI003F4910B7
MYYVYPKIGNTITGPPVAMSPEDYKEFMLAEQSKAFYRDKSDSYNLMFRKDKSDAAKKGLIPSLTINNRLLNLFLEAIRLKLFLRVIASFDFGGLYQKNR